MIVMLLMLCATLPISGMDYLYKTYWQLLSLRPSKKIDITHYPPDVLNLIAHQLSSKDQMAFAHTSKYLYNTIVLHVDALHPRNATQTRKVGSFYPIIGVISFLGTATAGAVYLKQYVQSHNLSHEEIKEMTDFYFGTIVVSLCAITWCSESHSKKEHPAGITPEITHLTDVYKTINQRIKNKTLIVDKLVIDNFYDEKTAQYMLETAKALAIPHVTIDTRQHDIFKTLQSNSKEKTYITLSPLIVGNNALTTLHLDFDVNKTVMPLSINNFCTALKKNNYITDLSISFPESSFHSRSTASIKNLFKMIVSQKNIERLSIENLHVPPQTFQKLEQNDTLKTLVLEKVRIDGAHIPILLTFMAKNYNNLQSLRLSYWDDSILNPVQPEQLRDSEYAPHDLVIASLFAT